MKKHLKTLSIVMTAAFLLAPYATLAQEEILPVTPIITETEDNTTPEEATVQASESDDDDREKKFKN